MIATSGFLTALECTKFVFGQSSAPDGLRSPTSKGRVAIGKERGRGEEGEGMEGERRKGE